MELMRQNYVNLRTDCMCVLARAYSGCGAPVLVSKVSTKNMKSTKTARPTQNPITMESAIIHSTGH